jgi:hypothetical protein
MTRRDMLLLAAAVLATVLRIAAWAWSSDSDYAQGTTPTASPFGLLPGAPIDAAAGQVESRADAGER